MKISKALAIAARDVENGREGVASALPDLPDYDNSRAIQYIEVITWDPAAVESGVAPWDWPQDHRCLALCFAAAMAKSDGL